jgi:hypothetical protein
MELKEMADELVEYVGITDKDGNFDPEYFEAKLSMLSDKDMAQRLARRILDQLHPADLKRAEKIAKESPTHYANTFFVDALKRYQEKDSQKEKVKAK